jgi:hypothetical protein
MKKINHNLLALVTGVLFITACNKDLETLPAIPKPVYPTGATVAATLAATPSDSLFFKMVQRSGLLPTFADSTRTYTLFAVDNAGMKIFVNAASGGLVPLNAPDAAFVSFINTNLTSATAAGIVQYNTLGTKIAAAAIPTTFPNFPYVTQIVLDPTQPFVRMNTFPAKNGANAYVNNIPITGVDQQASNGIIHHTFTVVAPPTTTLKGAIAADANLTYFRAAVTRADSGQAVGLGRIDSLLNYGVTNMTVLAPNDNAFRALIFGLAFQGYLATRPQPYTAADTAVATATGNGAVAAGPAFLATNNVSTALVRGIVAYHVLASLTASTSSPFQPNIRVFSTNLPSSPAFVKTLVNGSAAAHPGISARATFTGPIATAATFTGLGTFPSGGAPFSGPAANAVSIDRHAVNGVFHVIDRVLLPQ